LRTADTPTLFILYSVVNYLKLVHLSDASSRRRDGGFQSALAGLVGLSGSAIAVDYQATV
jgi:hypothetical protein